MPVLGLAVRGAKKVGKAFSPKTLAKFGIGETAVGAPTAASAVPQGLREGAQEFGLPGTAPTEQYRKRFGGDPNASSVLGDAGYRALGVASDIGNEILDPFGTGYLKDKFLDQRPQGAKGGRVKQGLRQGYERGGSVAKLIKMGLKRAQAQSVNKSMRASMRRAPVAPSVSPEVAANMRASVAARKPRQVIEAPEMKPVEAPKLGPLSGKPQPVIGSKAPASAAPASVTPGPQSVKERVLGVADKIRAKIPGLRSIPVSPTQAATATGRIAKKLGKGLAAATLIPTAAATAYKTLTSDKNPLAPVGESLSRGLSAAQEGTQRLADEYQGYPAGTQSPTGAAPVARTATPPASTAATEPPPPIPQGGSYNEGLRRQIVQQARPDPGAVINLGDYGGNANIFAGASRPGGRVDTFSGVGGPVSAEKAAADAARLARGQAVATSEANQLSGLIQAKLASGNPEDLDAARGLAVTPEHQGLIGAAEKHMGLREQARYSKSGRTALAAHEEGLRAAAAAAPKNALAYQTMLANAAQKGFDNQLDLAKTTASVVKSQREEKDAGVKRLYSSIDQLIPLKVNEKDNPENAAFKAFVTRSAGSANTSLSDIPPELLAKYHTDFKQAQASTPDLVGRLLASLGLGIAAQAETVGDVRATGTREGAFETQVKTPIGEVGASTFTARPGSGLRVPFTGSTLFPVQSPERIRELRGLRG